MRKLILIAGFVVLATAKPDMYKEKEDFQFSRSSSDDGEKSGFYGAQRGNMGGNYEKAHNMDTLAQSQMSGIMRQVHGELGSGINEPTGNVYGAASTRGRYGHGQYDLSNLSGRNFEESGSYGGASHGSRSSNTGYSGSHSSNAGYSGSRSSNAGYTGSRSSSASRSGGQSSSYSSQNRNSGSEREVADEFEAGSVAHSNQYRKGYERSSGYASQSRYSSQNEDQRRNRDFEKIDNIDQGHYRITPLKVILRPGSKVDVPFTAETLNAGNVEEFDENKINQESETRNQNNRAKNYQSSFSYRKEWEKHNSQPSAAPLSIPSGSSSYDAQAQDEYQNQHHSSSQYSNSRRNQGTKSSYSSAQPQYYQASNGYDQSYGKSSSMSQVRGGYGYDQNAYSSNADAQQSSSAYKDSTDSQNHIRSSEKSPKKYESSYSYHKSWERKGDPYVIIPGSDGTQASQRLTDASSNVNKYSQEYGSQQYKHSHQEYSKSHDIDC